MRATRAPTRFDVVMAVVAVLLGLAGVTSRELDRVIVGLVAIVMGVWTRHDAVRRPDDHA